MKVKCLLKDATFMWCRYTSACERQMCSIYNASESNVNKEDEATRKGSEFNLELLIAQLTHFSVKIKQRQEKLLLKLKLPCNLPFSFTERLSTIVASITVYPYNGPVKICKDCLTRANVTI